MDGLRQVLGTPAQIEFQGRTLSIPPWNIGQELEFAAWVQSQAENRLRAKRKDLGELAYREEMSALRRDIDSFQYEWGMETVVRAWQSLTGGKHLVFITLRDAGLGPVQAEKVRDEMVQDKEFWLTLWQEVLLPLNFPPVPEPEKEPTPEAAPQA